MIKAIIFDMDGLMIDSERATFQEYQNVLSTMNLTITEDFYKTLLGKTLKTAYKLFYKEYGEDFPIEEVIKQVHIQLADRFEKYGVPVKKWLIELLTYLKENNYKTIVSTSSHRERVDKILHQAHLTKYFDDSICGNEVTNGKPNPEVFLKACDKLEVKPEEAIVLEDSEAGILAAHNAAIKVICIVDMKYPDKEYEEKTYQILESLDQVIDLLK